MATRRKHRQKTKARSGRASLEPLTAWHPMLVALLSELLPPGWKLVPELLLSRLPQRLDLLIVRSSGAVAGNASRILSIFDHLRKHTLIEHKGPTDDLAGSDATVLLGYAFQYMALSHVQDPEDLVLMVIADRITRSFVKQIERFGGRFAPAGGGLWKGNVHGFALHGVATHEASRTGSTERLLYLFTRAFLDRPELISLEGEDVPVYLALYERVEQFKKQRGPTAMKNDQKLTRAQTSLLARVLRIAPPGLKEQYLALLSPEERLAGMPPEERLAGMPPEQWLAGMPPELRLLALSDDVLAAFPDEYLRSLSPKTQAAIRKRIGRPARASTRSRRR